ncbi:hypothetical protein GU243_00630 [Pseudarthrobacter psychrotolerans]|uniref:Multi-ubiquitin domain-containing protein n=1 Tax=Pseudarthrobacter psychrotolerans TaxID=2697569 RepID=A0A6P1ND80_9MICC|nr:multiubiquitin domain-containing protein [Pseudarthrobacter psychrotolerans]QHK18535.1 hypothetical protein GU243_00630 [Pseudarthrobacter psychrotolerans]
MAQEKQDNGHATEIYVNTRPHTWNENKISYSELLALAFPGEQVGEQDTVTIRYSRGNNGNGAGSLTNGHDVSVKKGMVFDVVRTSRS